MSISAQKWAYLLSPYTRNYAAQLTASEISKATGIPRQTAARLLHNLARQNLLQHKKDGNNKKYFLDLTSYRARIVLSLIEHERSLAFLSRGTVAALVVDLLQACESVVVFGSHASASAHEASDLDVVLLGTKSDGSLDALKRRSSIQINEHVLTEVEFIDAFRRREPLAVEILENHLLFGDISRLVAIMQEAQR